jgi:hypothetical protein
MLVVLEHGLPLVVRNLLKASVIARPTEFST